MDVVKFGSFLKELRKEHGLTQEELAEKLGVTNRTVSRWETGTNIPDIDILIYLSELYQVDLKELLEGERNLVLIPPRTLSVGDFYIVPKFRNFS